MLEQLAERLEGIRFETLPKGTVEKTKTAILNYIGGSLPGTCAPPVLAEKRFWTEAGAAGPCTLLGHGETLSPLAAAAVNAMMGQVFLQEDCHEKSISHPGVIVIPTALALGQALHLSGKELITGVVCGYEGQGRIGRCLIRPGFPRNGLRPAAWVGPFGSAAAAARLLKLDRDGICAALTVAANTCTGVMECTIAGSDDMCIQNCSSARNGIMAAFEAKHGLRGARSVLEGHFGLGRALNGGEECGWSALGEADGYEIDDTFIKIYPGCGHVLPTAQAAVELVRKYRLEPEDVDRVVVGTRTAGKTFPGCDNPGPFNGHISAMMSHQFMVGAALCTGNVSIGAVRSFADHAIGQMAARVEVAVDPEVDGSGKSGGRVTIFLKDGRVLSSLQEDTLGLSAAGVRERLRENGSRLYSTRRLEQIIRLTDSLEELPDVSEFAELLRPDQQKGETAHDDPGY